MQLRNLFISGTIIFCLKTNSIVDKIFFKDASLAYVNNCFVIYFKEIESFYNTFEVYINGEITTELNNIKKFNYIELPSLIYNKQNEIEVRLVNNYEQKRLFFNVNLNSFFNLTYQEEFKMNSLIDDYNKIFSFIDLQYFRIDNYNYEIVNNKSFLEFYKIGRMNYNQDFIFCNDITFTTKQKNLFDDLIFDDGYVFHFIINKSLFLNYSHVDQKCLRGSNYFYQRENLFLPVFIDDNFIEGEIIFHSFVNSKIALKIDVIFDLNNICFGPFGVYQIYIKDR